MPVKRLFSKKLLILKSTAIVDDLFLSLETMREGTNLMSGGRLEKGEKLMSGNRCFKLIMQEDGNLVLKTN